MSTSTAFGAFLVGLTARVVAIEATVVEGSTTEFVFPPAEGRPNDHDRKAFHNWTTAMAAALGVALRTIGIESNFRLRFDRRPLAGARLDLAALAACMGAVDRLGRDALGSTIFLGEIRLSGALRAVRGVLPIVRSANADRRPPVPWNPGDGGWRFAVPADNVAEALRGGAEHAFAVVDVRDLANDSGFPWGLRAALPLPAYRSASTSDRFLSTAIGPKALRALEIAAAGGHGAALVGHPKSCHVAAMTLWSILPPMTLDEAIEASEIHSAFDDVRDGLLERRPVQIPAQSSVTRGEYPLLTADRTLLRPPPISMAHRGLFLLNEASELSRGFMAAVERTLRAGRVEVVVRDDGATVSFPVVPRAFAIGLPRCFCDSASIVSHERSCTPDAIRAYHERALAQFRPRIDMLFRLTEPDIWRGAPIDVEAFERSSARVVAAAELLARTQTDDPSSDLSDDPAARIARTIAALDGRTETNADDLDEALSLTPGLAS